MTAAASKIAAFALVVAGLAWFVSRAMESLSAAAHVIGA